MNIFKLFLFLLISPLVFTSCETSQTPVDELSSLLEKIDNNSENYSEEDWNNITNEFTEIEEELSKYEYTDEELKEIPREKTKCFQPETERIYIRKYFSEFKSLFKRRYGS